jgi:hypothetical protein
MVHLTCVRTGIPSTKIGRSWCQHGIWGYGVSKHVYQISRMLITPSLQRANLISCWLRSGCKWHGDFSSPSSSFSPRIVQRSISRMSFPVVLPSNVICSRFNPDSLCASASLKLCPGTPQKRLSRMNIRFYITKLTHSRFTALLSGKNLIDHGIHRVGLGLDLLSGQHFSLHNA